MEDKKMMYEIYEVYEVYEDAANALNEFCRIFEVKIKKIDWDREFVSVTDTAGGCIYFATDIENPIRLRTYMINNYSCYYEEDRKYYSSDYKKCRCSRISRRRGCVLTGMCYDMDLLDPLYNFIDGKSIYNDWYDLMEDCIRNLMRAVNNEIIEMEVA